MSEKKKEFLEYELACLWSDLQREARHSRSSDPATPSIGMEWIMERIKLATALVGPIDWMSISIGWLMNGQYEHWAKYMEIDYNLPTEEELSKIVSKLQEVGWDEDL